MTLSRSRALIALAAITMVGASSTSTSSSPAPTCCVWAAAYMHIYAAPDPRLQASRFLYQTVPPGTRIVVEPSQNPRTAIG